MKQWERDIEIEIEKERVSRGGGVRERVYSLESHLKRTLLLGIRDPPI